jgi:hypothetical protein
MFIKQISVFLENKKGMLYNLTKTLADHDIDLKALSIADTAKFGILRLIVSDPERTLKVIKDANYTASVTEVLGVELEDRPGGLARVLAVLKDSDIAVEYLYSFVGTRSENAMIILRVDELEKAHQVLESAGYALVAGDGI